MLNLGHCLPPAASQDSGAAAGRGRAGAGAGQGRAEARAGAGDGVVQLWYYYSGS